MDSQYLNYDYDDSNSLLPPLQAHESYRDKWSDGESHGNLSEVFKFEEPDIHNVATEHTFCELYNASKQYYTWECKKVDGCNIPLCRWNNDGLNITNK